VLVGKARAVFNGKVCVRQDAQRTNAYQMNRNLLLSSEAEIDTKPELQIDADDVKCSHGAAVGQLNPDQVFYLESRGLDKTRAIALLSQAFANEALLKIEDEALRGRLAQLARSWGA
jgi:Fe-S cluster assembly protein SufD